MRVQRSLFLVFVGACVMTVGMLYDRTDQPLAAQAGPSVRVCGTVLSLECEVKTRTTHIRLEAGATKSVAPLAILGPDRGKFTTAPEDAYRPGAEICARGTLERHEKGPRLLVRRPDDVTVRKPPADSRTPWAGEHFYFCDDGIEPPQLTEDVKPSYTRAAMNAGKEGVVKLEAIVLADGTVGDVRLAKSLDATTGLDDQAIAALKKWRFKPGTRFAQPVPVVIAVDMTFTLKK
jgi:TonB family protein